jgi:hypothetical protein
MYIAEFTHNTQDRNYTAFEEAVSSLRKKLGRLSNRVYTIKLSQKDIKAKKGCHWQRSHVQNRLYHLWLNAISMETGNDTHSLHEYFKRYFLPYKEVKAFGKTIGVLSSTADLSVEEFDKFLKEVDAFASSELGMTLPKLNTTLEYYVEELPIKKDDTTIKKKL